MAKLDMMNRDLAALRAVKDFPSLVRYLNDELGWEFESDDVEDLTFEYEPEELGLDAATAAKVREIKQLRPLVAGQEWGIFFIDFEPKRLPVVALRRILSRLVIKKRAGARSATQAAWQHHDLLFISSYGEQAERAITFAHFSDNSGLGDLPTLKVLGWDAQDTQLSLEYTHRTLKEKLRFPDDPTDAESWRERWSSAFTLRHREVVTTSIELAKRLAELATLIRERANRVLAIESEKGAFRRLHEAFKEALIHDLSTDDFADMYAQTISYGLLSARVSRPAGLVADNLVDMVPSTNPFLKELLGTFLKIGGRDTTRANGGANRIDFDELGINEVVELLRRANMEAVLRDFGNRNPTEDPVIHFYQDFLQQYDREKRMKRGVFYTPRPVVSFIVRSVDEILRKEFDLADGLADTTTWGEFVKAQRLRNPQAEIRIPEGVSHEAPFVQILDPATGTGTFLVETIDVIYATLTEKWRKAGKGEGEIRELWNDYVPRHLLPRLYGFELMMAPYSIAHMKIGLKLRETGYSFLSSERARIYLTNTLEEPKDFSGYFAQMAPALAHEAAEANTIKRYTPITVVIGNPPYSVLTANLSDESKRLVDDYRNVDGEPIKERSMLRLEMHLQDDYVKFVRFSQVMINKAGSGVMGLITNNGYFDSLTLRGMRFSLLQTFAQMRLVNLHGSSLRKTEESRQANDQNVFDIEQGVAMTFGVRLNGYIRQDRSVIYSYLLGQRDDKYNLLLETSLNTIDKKLLSHSKPNYFFIPQDVQNFDEYQVGVSLTDLIPLSVSGIVTAHDDLVIDFEDEPLREKVKILINTKISDDEARSLVSVKDNAGWKLTKARKSLQGTSFNDKWFQDYVYRPFDFRRITYQPALIWCDRRKVMKHMLAGWNIGLVATRQTKYSVIQVDLYFTFSACTAS
ncbi:MAG: hypothetical protein LC778_08725 [Acidobacteria bacterium]|nr:hypothetical protein [Acidobacteriota bacterium]